MLGPVTLRWTSIPIQGVIELLQVASRYTNLVSSDLIGHLAPMQTQMLSCVKLSPGHNVKVIKTIGD